MGNKPDHDRRRITRGMKGWNPSHRMNGGETGSRGDTEDMRANFKNSRVGFSSCFETPGAAPRRGNNWAISRHFCLFLFFLSCPEGADAWYISLSGILERSKLIIIKLRIKGAAVFIIYRVQGYGDRVHTVVCRWQIWGSKSWSHIHSKCQSWDLNPLFPKSIFFPPYPATTQMEDENECGYFVSPKAPNKCKVLLLNVSL